MLQNNKVTKDQWEDALRQKQELLNIYHTGTPLDLVITRGATDERPIVDLKSEKFPNWTFCLSRRFCVSGFLHQLRVGTKIQLYIQSFGESQFVFGSYFKKDHLQKDIREGILSDLRRDIKRTAEEQIEYCKELKPRLVNIESILSDHIIVEYNGLYGTLTYDDLFYADTDDEMDYYRELKNANKKLEVYINSIDDFGNVRFSETRLPELINNSHYFGNENFEKKWIYNGDISDLEIGQEVEGLIWQYMRNTGIFVLYKDSRGAYIQSLIPNTALTQWDFHEWKDHFKIGDYCRLRIKNINREDRKITLTIPDVDQFKYKEEYVFEQTTTMIANQDLLEDGKEVEIIIMSSCKENDNIIFARTTIKDGDKYLGGYLNIDNDLPDSLSHASLRSGDGRVRRTLLGLMISHKPKSEQEAKYIMLPAIVHIEDNRYRFSIMDAVNKSIKENFKESDFRNEFKARKEEVEVVYSWKSSLRDIEFLVFRWRNLFSFLHVSPEDKKLLSKDEDFYSGMKLKVWIKGINKDLSFDSDADNPYLRWKSLQLKRGQLIATQGIWLSGTANDNDYIYKTKYMGCSAFILPGFCPDENNLKLSYIFRVVYLNKNSRKLVLDYCDKIRSYLRKSDIGEKTTRQLSPLTPLGDNLFLMEDKESKKLCIMQSSAAGSVLIQAIYNHFNLNKEDFRSDAYFTCSMMTADSGDIYFEWNGNFNYSSYYNCPLDDTIAGHVEFKDIKLSDIKGDIFKLPSKRKGVALGLECALQINGIPPIDNVKVRFTGKFIIRKGVMYPLFSVANSQMKSLPNDRLVINTPYKRNATNYSILVSGGEYIAEITDLSRGEIKIHVGNQSTYYYLNLTMIMRCLFSKEEMDTMQEGKYFKLRYTIDGNDKGRFEPALSEEQYNRRKRNVIRKDKTMIYWFQVISKINNASKGTGGYAGFILNRGKDDQDYGIIDRIEDNDNQLLFMDKIDINEIIPVYYDESNKKISITPSKEFIQSKYRKMFFKAMVIEQKDDKVYLESGGNTYYASLLDENNRKPLLNQFGKVMLFPNMSVFIRPAENNKEWPSAKSEVVIIGRDSN